VKTRHLALLVVCVGCMSCGSAESGRATNAAHSSAGLRLGKPVRLPAKVEDELVTASTLAAGNVLLLGTSGGDLYALDRDQAGAKPRRLASLSQKITDIAASPDGRMVGAVSVAGTAAVGPVAGTVRVGPLDISPMSVSFDGSGDRVAFGGFGVAVYDANTGQPTETYEQPMPAGGRSPYDEITFTKSGEVSAISAEGVDRWTPASPLAVGTTIGCECAAAASALSRDGATAAFGTADGHVVILDVGTGQIREDRTVSTNTNDHVFAVAVSGSGRRIVAFAASGKGLLWDQRLARATWRGRLIGKLNPSNASFVHENALKIDSQTGDSDDGTGFGLAPFLVRMSA
jgi:hypothetical protein